MKSELIKQIMVKSGFDPAAIERMGIMPQAKKFAELLIKEIVSELQLEIHRSCRTLTYDLDDHIKMVAREDALDDAMLIVKSILE